MAITEPKKTNPDFERFKRIELMLGRDAYERLQNSRVTVVGLGAVGSYAVEGLARAGINNLRLVDFDNISQSNFNRQLYALESTLGRAKCEVAKDRVLDINPGCNVEAISGFVDNETVYKLIGESPNLVIDAIDSLGPKVELLASVRQKNINLVSCLGAALRTDPAFVRVGTLNQVHGCPLGKDVRRLLRRREVEMDFPCVYSDEPLPKPLPIAAPVGEHREKAVLERGRVRNILGSLPTLTGIFGLTAANLAIKLLIADN